MRSLAVGLLALALFSACASRELDYAVARGEFDSVTGYGAGVEEPVRLEFKARAERWPWVVRLFYGSGFDWTLATVFGVRPTAREIPNPSGFARERLTIMNSAADGSLGHLADLAVRALWLAANDPQPLDQIVAIGCVERMLATLEVDPLAIPLPDAGNEAMVQSVDADLRRLDNVAPWTRGARAPSSMERRQLQLAVARLTARPQSSAAAGRRLLRFLHRAASVESDPELREIFYHGLIDGLANEGSQLLRIKLHSTDNDEATGHDEVRCATLLAMFRLSGPKVVPWSLWQLSRSGAGRLDSSERVRRLWIRLCAALPADLTELRFEGGPSAVDYLYDTVKRDEVEGLRTLGLEALALSLGRDVSHDASWADAWWQERSLRQPGVRQ